MSDSGRKPVEPTSGSSGQSGGDDQPGCSPDRADPDPCQPIEVMPDAAMASGTDVSAEDAAWLRQQLVAAIDAADIEVMAFNVVLVDDGRMTEMHRQYHHDPTTTDVLTFDLRDEVFAGAPEAGRTPAVEGEVYLCVDEAKRRAAQLGHDLRHELLLYALHGLLHLIGYDDQDDEDRARMHQREDELLEMIGVGRVYEA